MCRVLRCGQIKKNWKYNYIISLPLISNTYDCSLCYETHFLFILKNIFYKEQKGIQNINAIFV